AWCGRKVARLVEEEAPAPPAFQVGDEVIWLKRIPGGDYVFPIAATILEFTSK
nr:hypothetical protein [Ardenticatenales bacterium]